MVKDNSERWLLTYSDLMNLLMILFILLYSMSNVDQVKYDRLAQSLSSAFGSDSILQGSNGIQNNILQSITPGIQVSPGSTATGNGKTSITTKKDMENLKETIDKVLNQYHAGKSISTSIEKRGLVISFQDNVFFDSGDDQLKAEMKSGLDRIDVLLNRITNSILVEGHTDNVPISSSKFSSNWQLSACRAANVAQYIEEQGKIEGKRLTPVGYGPNRPIASNDTESGRSKNRRINLVILYDGQDNTLGQ
jgi:Flagellar motor protein